MATLTINIDVKDEDFKQLCVDNINDLPKEQMTELLLKAVEVALIKDKEKPDYDINTSILVNRVKTQYSYKYEPTKLLISVMKSIDTEKYFKDIADEVATYIRDNYRDLIREYLVKSFMDLLFTDANRYELELRMNDNIRNALR